mgnify:FL=1
MLRPQSHALALEPRILFDAAAAVAADQQHDATHGSDGSDHAVPAPTTPAPEPAPPQHLLVVDSQLPGRERLFSDLDAQTHLLIVRPGEDALAAITGALASLGQVDSIQIFSHGSAGQFSLGNATFTSDSIRDMGASLEAWCGNLSDDADIQLYGCNVGSGVEGRALVAELARWTGADVGASDDNTGSTSHGGDWILEVTSGEVDKALALDSSVLASFDGLLAANTSLSGAGADVDLGSNFTFTVNFRNDADPVAFGPFVDLFLPATGRDGDDGVTFVSASYLGQTVKSYVMTFDANGNATHPLAVDNAGNPLVIRAADYGLQAGDQFVVLQLPFASVSKDQPTIAVQVTAHLSDLADTTYSDSAPNLTLLARGGFQFGNDALNNPATDPSQVEAATHAFVVRPTVLQIGQSVDVTEGETATGPNYPHRETTTVSTAPGQSLQNVTITQPLPLNIQVTAITPGAAGTITQITLFDGTEVTDPALIALHIASDGFLASYTVEYASVTGSVSSTVDFYVPQSDANGNAVISAATGADATVTFPGAQASAIFTPADPRDVPEDVSVIQLTGQPVSFTASSITLHKEVTDVIDLGASGIDPGDVLSYAVNLEVSDYFAFGWTRTNQGQFVIVDELSDGHTLVPGSATFSVTLNGETYSVPLVATMVTHPDGTTSLTVDIAQSLRDAGLLAALPGDLAFDPDRSSATRAVISYSAIVDQNYDTGYDDPDINEGDPISNHATLTASVVDDADNLTGFVVSDDSSTSTVVKAGSVDIEILSVNGGTPPANGELRPGDLVVFRMSYTLTTGDFDQFSLTSNLPLPLFDVSGIAWTQGSGERQWDFDSSDTSPHDVVNVTSAAGNAVVFDFGSESHLAPARIAVVFTLRVGDQPFADQRSITAQAQSRQLTTIDQQPFFSLDAVAIQSIAEPMLLMAHGVVAASNGTVTGTTGSWNAPGTTGRQFSGNVTELSAIEGSVTGIDGGDRLRLATAIENTGGGAAFDVATTVTLPPGLAFVGGSLGSANVLIYRGDGTALVAGTDYSISGNAITFSDAGNAGSLLPGRPGTTADANGTNLVVITYDVIVDNGILAARTLQSTAALTHYASTEGGTDFAPVDLTDTADQQIASPEVRKEFAGGSLDDADSSAAHTRGDQLVIGERMLYDVIVRLPEGSTQTLRLQDLVPDGMQLDTSFGGTGYQLITSRAGSTALVADFNGSVSASRTAGTGETVGGDVAFTFSASSASADNDVDNNAFVIRLQLIAVNVAASQSGTLWQNEAEIIFSDPDGDVANGSTPQDRTLELTGGGPTINIVEPTVTVAQSITQADGSDITIGVDAGDVINIVITLRNTSGIDAFDLSFSDVLPAQLGSLQFLSNNPGFELVGNELRTVAGADVDLANGGSITLSLSGTVLAQAAGLPSFDNVATVQWTSLNGADTGERTGVEGTLNSGVLNDYRSANTANIRVSQADRFSRIGGLPDTVGPASTADPRENVTVGEIIRYRVVSLVPEGVVDSANLQITLADGLEFINDGTIRIAFVSSNPMTTTLGDLATGQLIVTGNEGTEMTGYIAKDLSGQVPAAVLNPAYIHVNGNVIVFDYGTLTNSDRDADFEGVVVEFNVRVVNVASNVAGTALSAQIVDRSGTTQIASPQTLYQDIVEPSFGPVDKRVIWFDPNPTGTTGTARVSVSFTQNSNLSAFDAHLEDDMTSGSNYSLVSVTIGSNTYTAANLPAGVTFSTSGRIVVDFASVAPGIAIRVVYEVTVPNALQLASRNATLTWSSLPETFTTWGGSAVGSDGTAGGERTGAGTSPNTYIRSEGAGLGIITGRLWDDSGSPTGSAMPDGPGLAGQTVTLTWAGADNNLGTAADNLVFTAVTTASGDYGFGVLPAGTYRMDAPTEVTYPQPLGTLRVRIDSGPPATFGIVNLGVSEGGSQRGNFGYVQLNDAPVNTLPSAQSGLEDVPLALAPFAIADVDAGSGMLDVTFGVLHGTLSLSSTPAGVTVTGSGTSSLRLSGTLTALNEALANVVYLGNANFNGVDTLTMTTGDRGNFGDADGDGFPAENPEDQRIDSDALTITLAPVNDPPDAVDDVNIAVEAGGVANATPGTNPSSSLFLNDTDVDIATNDDRLHVVSVDGPVNPLQTVPVDGFVDVAGQYGTLRVTYGGGYQYFVDNTLAAVQALRTSGQTLTEQFTYVMADLANVQDTATLTLTLQGANDAPVGVADAGIAVEAGGVANGTGGSDATGFVLTNDQDVDSTVNGEALRVTGVRNVGILLPGPVVAVTAGTTSANGTSIAGLYGTLTLGADGSYRYVVDDANADVQAMATGDTLIDNFSYEVTDVAGLHDLAALQITIQGTQDNPVASDDVAIAQAGSASSNESNPTFNVITLPSRPNPPGSNGVDSDVDAVDQPNSVLRVNGIRTGIEGAGGTLTTVVDGGPAIVLAGSYGTLTIQADGSASYDVDSDDTDVQALLAGQTLQDAFTYQLADTAGLTDLAQITITIYGVNDVPIAGPSSAIAIEAGGVDNGSGGQDATGDALTRTTDPDGDPLEVVAIRTGVASGTDGIIGQPLAGTYGSLTIAADGSYTYAVNNADPTVQALRRSGDLLFDTFTYTIADPDGQSSQAQIIIVIRGNDDTPVAVDDVAATVEAGGVNNNRPGTPATGNVLTDLTTGDTDVDGHGETQRVSSVRTGNEAAIGGTAGTVGVELRGTYGWLTIGTDGRYSYRLDETMAAVEALRMSSDTLQDQFSYTVADALGAEDRATLTINIRGANDTPVAVDDAATAIEAGGIGNATAGSNATGNVLANDSDVDGFGETLTVIGVEHGAQAALTGVPLQAAYGTLTLNADGTFTYVVDNANPLVEALRTASQALTETFRYSVRDASGALRTATLTITIEGRDDNPVAVNDSAIAVESGGTANATPGVDPSGNVLGNDTDVDAGDRRAVIGIRTGAETTGAAFAGFVGQHVIQGLYGALTVNTDGTWSYRLDNTLPAVEALRQGEVLQEVFTYGIRDLAGATDAAELRIQIQGAWDAPIAVDDINSIAANSLTPVSGNVFANDTDVDHDDTLVIVAANFGDTPLRPVRPGTNSNTGGVLIGQYGTLQGGADGSYRYYVDVANPAVLALGPSDFLVDDFTYAAADLGLLTDRAQLRITIQGRNEAPLPTADIATAAEAGGIANASGGVDPSGNVLSNDSDLEGDPITVIGISSGNTGAAGVVGTPLQGRYGSLLIAADGTWQYTLDNALAEVQALRLAGQTLQERFTYTVADQYGDFSLSELLINIQGSNDTPVALDDAATAIEAGGVGNATPGADAVGNVMTNDADVDSAANGETLQVLGVVDASGTTVPVGQALAGSYGQLTLQADGSYRYVVDNTNAVVQALRTAGETISETFTYRLVDAAGATTDAHLQITIQGANDAPVAADDSSTAIDQLPAPHATGNVLPNDSDVDAGDALSVVGIRAGRENGSGATGIVGQPLAGQYGTLVLQADGSYAYTIDLTNPDVLAAAGLGQVLQDVFTYTLGDREGAVDLAEIVIHLDISAPYIPVDDDGPHSLRSDWLRGGSMPELNITPRVFVHPVVQRAALFDEVAASRSDGSDIRWTFDFGIRSRSLLAPLDETPGQHVREAVRASQLRSEYDMAWILGRHSRSNLSADGLLPDPSVFAIGREGLLGEPPQAERTSEVRAAPSFTAQLRAAADRFRETR